MRYRVRCIGRVVWGGEPGLTVMTGQIPGCGWVGSRIDHVQCECYDINRMYCRPFAPGPGCPRGVDYPCPRCRGAVTGKAINPRRILAAICAVKTCDRKRYANGYCTTHLMRLKRHGDPLWEPPTNWERFMSHVEIAGDCWRWTGSVNYKGYGHSRWGAAHRYAYEQLIGPIPASLELDHLCHNLDLSCEGGNSCVHRRCVNPDHLEPVTALENTRRRVGRGSA